MALEIQLISASNSTYFVPASGSEDFVKPKVTVTVQVSGSSAPSASWGGFTEEISTRKLTATGSGVSGNVLTKTFTFQGGANHDYQGARVDTGSILCWSATDATQSVPVYLEYESLNGNIVYQVDDLIDTGSITSVTFSPDKTEFDCLVMYWGLSTPRVEGELKNPVCSDSTWTCTSSSIYESVVDMQVMKYHFSGSVNTGSLTRTTTISFPLSSSQYHYVSNTPLVVNQLGYSRTLWPVWKDTETVVTASSAAMEISRESETVFDETVYAYPDDNSMEINVNRYVESLVECPSLDSILSGSTSFSQSYLPARFVYTISPGAAGSYSFYDDWSYDSDFDPNSTPYQYFSKPITKRYAIGQYLMYTYKNNTASAISGLARILKDGTNMVQVTIPSYSFMTVGYKVDECATWGAGSYSWTENVDADYAIYYLNPYTGWDTFPLEGRGVPSYSYERYSVINPRRNKYDYKIGKEQRYTLHTGLLKDSESLLMDYLTSSPRLYLHDLVNDVVVPVRMDNSEIQKKTFKNQDRTFPSYQFQVVECQQRIRR